MAVYTPLNESELSALASLFGLGALLDFNPVGSGIENTNYKVKTTRGSFIATLYERAGLDQVEKILRLTAELGALGLPVAIPVVRGGKYAVLFNEKPASATPCIEGRQLSVPSSAELFSIGRTLAEIHVKGSERGVNLPEGFHLWSLLAHEVERCAAKRPDMASEMIFEARKQAILPEKSIPTGFIHADLFLDNLIFEAKGDGIAAVLDFFMAGRGPLIYDLAVAALDGCFSGGKLDEALTDALFEGYERVRTLEREERENFLPYVRRAALRYLCLRIDREGEKRSAGEGKDPRELYLKLVSLKG